MKCYPYIGKSDGKEDIPLRSGSYVGSEGMEKR